MLASVRTRFGSVTLDISDGDTVEIEAEHADARIPVRAGLPLEVAADQCGARIVAIVDRRPPLVVSEDAGATWREAGAGLPAGVAVAIARSHPDRILFASTDRVYVSEDGGRFWRALVPEFLGIEEIAWIEQPGPSTPT